VTWSQKSQKHKSVVGRESLWISGVEKRNLLIFGLCTCKQKLPFLRIGSRVQSRAGYVNDEVKMAKSCSARTASNKGSNGLYLWVVKNQNNEPAITKGLPSFLQVENACSIVQVVS